MRNVQSLMSWEEAKKILMKNKEYRKVYERMKPKYELANSLIAIRLKKKLSQKKLAERIGTKQPVISRLESMASKPSFSLLDKISKALGVKLRIYFQP